MQDDITVSELKDIGQQEAVLGSALARLRSRREWLLRTRTAPTERQVTDHAIVRYLERVEGVDIEAIKARLRAFTESCHKTAMRGVLAHPTGAQVILNRSGLIVTVLPEGERVPHESADWDHETEGAA